MTDRRPQPWGPWVLALGALLIGVVALFREALSTFRRRLRRRR